MKKKYLLMIHSCQNQKNKKSPVGGTFLHFTYKAKDDIEAWDRAEEIAYEWFAHAGGLETEHICGEKFAEKYAAGYACYMELYDLHRSFFKAGKDNEKCLIDCGTSPGLALTDAEIKRIEGE